MTMRRRAFVGLALSASFGAFAQKSRAVARPHVVIVGGGFAGATCAIALRRSKPEIDVTLIDPDDRYFTGPMSNAVLAGWRTLDSIRIGRHGLRRSGVRYVRDRVVSIDGPSRRVSLGDGKTVGYDRLVVAPGVRFLFGTPQSYDESVVQRMPHAWTAGAQTALLAAQLRAMRNGGTFAISVPAGLMRCPPGPFDRASVVAAFLKQYKPRSKVLIFDANNRFPKQDIFTAAWRELYPGMIEWLPPADGGNVERVDAHDMTLYTSRGAQRVDVANIIPPQAPGQLALDAGLCTGHGWCPVDATTFESAYVKNVHVIGDACIAGAMPKSASAAHSQARQCARAIVASLDGNSASAPTFDSVCYSMLARDRALSIHGRYHVAEGEITSENLPPSSASQRQEVALAERWYRDLIASSFAD
jgi:sulfide dehydrogenase [flavocytochrome c] flavoprotein subunit